VVDLVDPVLLGAGWGVVVHSVSFLRGPGLRRPGPRLGPPELSYFRVKTPGLVRTFVPAIWMKTLKSPLPSEFASRL